MSGGTIQYEPTSANNCTKIESSLNKDYELLFRCALPIAPAIDPDHRSGKNHRNGMGARIS